MTTVASSSSSEGQHYHMMKGRIPDEAFEPTPTVVGGEITCPVCEDIGTVIKVMGRTTIERTRERYYTQIMVSHEPDGELCSFLIRGE